MPESIEDKAIHKVVLTEKECAKRLGLSFWTLRQMRIYGDAPHIRLGNRIYYVFDTVVEWLSQQASESKTIRAS